jgi:hypothetical protein
LDSKSAKVCGFLSVGALRFAFCYSFLLSQSPKLQASETLQRVKESNVDDKDRENQGLGPRFDTLFPLGRLPSDHIFSWETICKDPKKQHDSVSVRGSWYKTMQYEVLHTGGFLRLCTLRGRAYWNLQNTESHTTPDWKIHFSIADLSQAGLAWNIIAALFIERYCDFGMKVVTVEDGREWPEKQHGRELTVYIYHWDKRFSPKDQIELWDGVKGTVCSLFSFVSFSCFNCCCFSECVCSSCRIGEASRWS